jgi:hypothetical protein
LREFPEMIAEDDVTISRIVLSGALAALAVIASARLGFLLVAAQTLTVWR